MRPVAKKKTVKPRLRPKPGYKNYSKPKPTWKLKPKKNQGTRGAARVVVNNTVSSFERTPDIAHK